MELKAYWLAVKAGWKIVLATAVAAVAVAALLFWPSSDQYASSTRLFVSAQTGTDDLSEYYVQSAIAQQRLTSYVDLATSRSVVAEVNELLDLEVDSADVTALVVPTTSIIEVSATDTEPERAQEIAAAFATVLPQVIEGLDPAGESTGPLTRATVIDAADLPSSPVPTPFLRNLAFALVLGLGAGAAVAVLRYAVRQENPTGDRPSSDA